MQHVSYVLASPDVVGEKFQEGMFILSLKSGKYFDVGNRYVALLKAFESGISVQALKNAADQIEAGAGNQITDAVNKLDFFDLLRETPASVFEVKREVCEEIFAAGPTFHVRTDWCRPCSRCCPRHRQDYLYHGELIGRGCACSFHSTRFGILSKTIRFDTHRRPYNRQIWRHHIRFRRIGAVAKVKHSTLLGIVRY